MGRQEVMEGRKVGRQKSQGRQEDGETEKSGESGRQGAGKIGRWGDRENPEQTCLPKAHAPSDLLLLSKAPNSDSTPGSESRYL